MREITSIIVHCSASSYGDPTIIRGWHLGRGMDDIAYHLVIGNGYQRNSRDYWPEADGMVWPGRDLDDDGDVFEEIGAHAYGANRASIGICLVGKSVFTSRQFDALYGVCARLCDHFGLDEQAVIGHYETPYEQSRGAGKKSCPNIPGHELRAGTLRAIQMLRGADTVSGMVREALH